MPSPPEELSPYLCSADAFAFAAEQGLRPHSEVAKLWEMQSGQQLSESAIGRILLRTMNKMSADKGLLQLLDGMEEGEVLIPTPETSAIKDLIDGLEGLLYVEVDALEGLCPMELRRLSAVAKQLGKKIEAERNLAPGGSL